MSRAAVASFIGRLDALSRTRSLTPGETIQLDRMIAMERRYDAMAAARSRKKPGAEQLLGPAPPNSDSPVAAGADQSPLGPRVPRAASTSPETRHA